LYKVSADAYESNNFIGTTLATEAAIAKSILITGGYKVRIFFFEAISCFTLYLFSFLKKDAIPIRAKKV
jgi:hypothetical protein